MNEKFKAIEKACSTRRIRRALTVFIGLAEWGEIISGFLPGRFNEYMPPGPRAAGFLLFFMHRSLCVFQWKLSYALFGDSLISAAHMLHRTLVGVMSVARGSFSRASFRLLSAKVSTIVDRLQEYVANINAVILARRTSPRRNTWHTPGIDED